MEQFHFIVPIESFMPAEPDPNERVVYLKVFTSEDPHAWLDEVEPEPEELLLLEAVS